MIEIKNVSKIYGKGDAAVNALRNVNITIADGEFVSIIGPSGSGKSTLLNILGGIDTPTSGEYYLNKNNIATLSNKKIADLRNIEFGFVLQYFGLINDYTVYENVMLPLKYSNKFKGKSLRIILLVIGYIMLYTTTNISDFSIEKYLGIELIVKFMPIFIIGAFAHEYKNKFNAIIASDKLLTLSIILGGISIYYTCYFWEFPEIYTKYQILISIISQIALVIVVFNIVKAWCETKFHSLASSWIIKKLQFIGKESLSIYLLHYFFLFPITWLRQPMVDMGLGFTPLFVISLLVAIKLIAITLGVSHIISRSKLLSVFLLGKN